MSSTIMRRHRQVSPAAWPKLVLPSTTSTASRPRQAPARPASHHRPLLPTLPPAFVIAALTSDTDRLTLSVKHSITKPVPPMP